MARTVVCYDAGTWDVAGVAPTTSPITVTDAALSTSDITTNNATTAKHGFAPKYPNDATKYLDGTGAYTVPAGSGAAFGAVLFDSTLGSDTASIDTGAGGIASGYHFIQAMLLLRTDDVAAAALFDMTLNNDTGAVYDLQVVAGTNVTATVANALAQTSWVFGTHGNGGTAGYPSVHRMTFPGYDQTSFLKIGEHTGGRADATANNNQARVDMIGYRSSTAISRMKVAAQGAAKFKTGSRLTVVGW